MSVASCAMDRCWRWRFVFDVMDLSIEDSQLAVQLDRLDRFWFESFTKIACTFLQYYYDYVLDQLSAFRNRSQHHLTWIHQSTVTHESLNDAQYVDLPLHRLLTRLFDAGHHHNSMIFLYSDHAIKIGPILETESGFHESRLPFLYIYVPDSMYLQDSQGNWMTPDLMRQVLRYNSRQLTSQMDVHATLRCVVVQT